VISRIARLGIDALTADGQPRFGVRPEEAPREESSFLSFVTQRFCSDEELADQLQSGNPDALTVLFKRHSPVLFGIARRILRNDAEAEDAVQQIFLDVFRSIHQFDVEKGSFKTWLLMFAYQRTLNSRRAQLANKFFVSDPLELVDGGTSESAGSAGKPSPAENNILVEQVLKTLQPRQRRTIELVYYEGLTSEEIAVRTGESVCVVRHNLYRGLEKLRRAFSDRRESLLSSKGGSL